MKTINETFTDEEYKAIKKVKKKMNWHDFILLLVIHAKEAVKRGDLEIGDKK